MARQWHQQQQQKSNDIKTCSRFILCLWLKELVCKAQITKFNGMLRHSLATLEGCNLLWHIVAPSSLLSIFFCLLGLNDCLPAPVNWGMAIRSFIGKIVKKIKCLSSLIQAAKGGRGNSLFPQSTLILNKRGLFEENPFMKNWGLPWKEGEIRLEVDKIFFYTDSA